MSSQQYIEVDLGAESGRSRQAMIVRATIEGLEGKEPVRQIDRWQPGQPKTTESVTYPHVLRDVP